MTLASSDLNFSLSPEAREILARVRAFVADDVLPLEDEYLAEVGGTGERWAFTPRMTEIMEGLKARARTQALWNLWLTDDDGGAGLSTVEYAHMAEEMGKSRLAPEAMNCAAPDTGNMEVLARFANAAQKAEWLEPLLNGEIRSAYVMSEPDVASSDANNLAMPAVLEGDEWVLTGEKFFASGAGDPRCKIMIVMALTDPEAPRHQQHSQILVPMETAGVEVLRPMLVFGADDAPHGHMHIRFNDVRVPETNVIMARGKGFQIAQGRLGPGRIHHCMRLIGVAERALELLCRRAVSRTAFGKPLAQLGANHDIIADARIEIEKTRLLCLKAAFMMDSVGVREAQPWISMVKTAAPAMALRVIDEAIQMHGGSGVTQDFPLAEMYAQARTLRFADGPDAVHRRQVARAELKRYSNTET